MRVSPSPAVVLFSLSADARSGEAGSMQAVTAAAESMLQFLVEHDVAATWGTRSPVDFKGAGAIDEQHPRQALAISLAADDSPRIVEQLRREALRSRAAGLSVASALVPRSLSGDMYQLLVKYGIAAIHIAESGLQTEVATSRGLWRRSRWLLPLSARASEIPQKLRWGLWRMPQALDLARDGVRRLRQAVDRAVGAGDMVHLHVDLAEAASQHSRLMDDARSVVRQIASYADQGRLRSETLAGAAAGLTWQRVAAPACSILRRRAA
ncbi:MAG TPA: hypothetical protein VHD36_11275 [Pirellulales bacterium]|nr:hypothetical protein [Pirellulales bacterium]